MTMPSSSGSRQRRADDGVAYTLVSQDDPNNAGSPLGINHDLAAGLGGRFPCPVAPSSYVESLFGDATGAGGTDTGRPYTAHDFLESYAMQGTTILLIVLNAIVIGFETDYPDMTHWDIIENGFLVAFTIELVTKMIIIGPAGFFRWNNNADITWNMFDLTIVSCGVINLIVEFVVGETGKLGKSATLFRMIRLMRILRVLRIIRIVRFLKQLYLLAYGFIEGTMAVFWVSLLASFGLYICAVILVRTYGRATEEEDHNWEFFRDHFGNIPKTMFALFELMAAPDLVPYKHIMFQYPPLVVFLVTFIVLGSFGINGLLVALINESILEKNQARLEADRIDREAKRKLMQTRCRDVFDSMDVNGNRVLPRSEIMKCKGEIMAIVQESGSDFRSHDLDQMFYIMDYNDTGIVDRGEFVQGVVELCDQIRPMSIMELHCQVSKCASKIEACDNKMEGLVKAIEIIEEKEERRLTQCDRLVSNLSDTADKMHLVQTREAENASRAGGATGGATSSGLPMTRRPSNDTSSHRSNASAHNAMHVGADCNPCNAELRQQLQEQQLKLAEASHLIGALLKTTREQGPDALSTTSPAELSGLTGSLFRLQDQTTGVLETLFAQSSRPLEVSAPTEPRPRSASK